MIAELKRCGEITIAAIAALDDEFVADKRRIMQIAANVEEQGYTWHMGDHFTQMQSAIEAARQT